jgi:protoporphyrin/coproporphyrin ferrochelatase
LRPYLKEFLSDRRVVEIPRLIWWLILNGIILNTRPKKSAEKYASIWRPEGSPLKLLHRPPSRTAGCRTGRRGAQPIVVDYAMRYGQPSVDSQIRR